MTDEYKARKRRELARLAGRPANVLPHEHAQGVARIVELRAAGMSYAMMARQADLEKTTLQCIGRGQRKSMRRATYEAIMRVHWTPPVKGANRRFGSHVDVKPTWRRLAALNAAGYPLKWIAQQMDYNWRNMNRVMRGHSGFVYGTTAGEVAAIYAKLNGTDPSDWGIAPASVERAKREAARKHYPPAHCWDDDTIDDLAAYPEWTGECGSVSGYYLHLKYGIEVHETKGGSKAHKHVLCEPCKSARVDAARRYKQVDEQGIWEAIQQGIPYRSIADQFGCSTRTVQRVKRDKTGEADVSSGGNGQGSEEPLR